MSKLYFRKGPVEVEIDRRQLAEGTDHEMEHTRSRRIARKIALDHLFEIPDYYSRLAKMEHDYYRNGGLRL